MYANEAAMILTGHWARQIATATEPRAVLKHANEQIHDLGLTPEGEAWTRDSMLRTAHKLNPALIDRIAKPKGRKKRPIHYAS
jgi:hypothetical protein